MVTGREIMHRLQKEKAKTSSTEIIQQLFTATNSNICCMRTPSPEKIGGYNTFSIYLYPFRFYSAAINISSTQQFNVSDSFNQHYEVSTIIMLRVKRLFLHRRISSLQTFLIELI